MKKKTLVAMLVCGLIFTTTACGEKKNNTENKTDNSGNNTPKQEVIVKPTANTTSDVINDALVDGLKISNVALISTGEHAEFTAYVQNMSEEVVNVKTIDIIMKDEKGEEIVTLKGIISRDMQPNEIVDITSGVEMNLSSVASIEYKRNY